MVVEQESLPKSARAAWRRAALDGLQFLRMLTGLLRVGALASVVCLTLLWRPLGAAFGARAWPMSLSGFAAVPRRGAAITGSQQRALAPLLCGC